MGRNIRKIPLEEFLTYTPNSGVERLRDVIPFGTDKNNRPIPAMSKGEAWYLIKNEFGDWHLTKRRVQNPDGTYPGITGDLGNGCWGYGIWRVKDITNRSLVLEQAGSNTDVE